MSTIQQLAANRYGAVSFPSRSAAPLAATSSRCRLWTRRWGQAVQRRQQHSRAGIGGGGEEPRRRSGDTGCDDVGHDGRPERLAGPAVQQVWSLRLVRGGEYHRAWALVRPWATGPQPGPECTRFAIVQQVTTPRCPARPHLVIALIADGQVRLGGRSRTVSSAAVAPARRARRTGPQRSRCRRTGRRDRPETSRARLVGERGEHLYEPPGHGAPAVPIRGARGTHRQPHAGERGIVIP